jgi:hypothetical protein
MTHSVSDGFLDLNRADSWVYKLEPGVCVCVCVCV